MLPTSFQKNKKNPLIMISSPLKVASKSQSQTIHAIRLAMRCSWQVVGRRHLPLFEDKQNNKLCLVRLDMQYVHTYFRQTIYTSPSMVSMLSKYQLQYYLQPSYITNSNKRSISTPIFESLQVAPHPGFQLALG